jgi:hypothetical protein
LTCASASPFPKIRDEQTSNKNPGGDWWCYSVGASYIEKAEVIQRERKEDLRYVIEDYTSLHHHSSRAIHSVYIAPQMDEGYILCCWAVH